MIRTVGLSGCHITAPVSCCCGSGVQCGACLYAPHVESCWCQVPLCHGGMFWPCGVTSVSQQYRSSLPGCYKAWWLCCALALWACIVKWQWCMCDTTFLTGGAPIWFKTRNSFHFSVQDTIYSLHWSISSWNPRECSKHATHISPQAGEHLVTVTWEA